VEQVNDVGFEVLTAVVMQCSVLWDVDNKPLLATCFHSDVLLSLFFDHEDGGGMFLRNID
jgi:hypothetical protein